MAPSSSAKPLKGPQVFISFRGDDVRKHFISFLDPALRRANINVFIDENEFLGADLANLFTRIEESEIALVIFSKNYADSDWCLDELAKMKERKDQGRLRVIPIFYNLSPSVVKELRQDFGDKFRDMQRRHKHQPERTKKWEEALVSVPDIKGMPLSEQSDRTDNEFINSLVVEIQRLLDYMAVKGTPTREENHHGGYMVPSIIPARQLQITHYDNSQKWAWIFINEAPNYEELEVAKMIKIHWLKIVGTYDDTSDLTPGAKYEAVFLVKLEDNAIGWEQPVTLKLKVEQHDGSDDNRVDRNESLKDYIGHNWVDILAGVFVAPPRNKPAKITFTMFQHVTDDKKKGLVVKGVAIRPTN
ncbi:BnaC09g52030D [Brassica napus]|uniref:BnaC09g52030D protein n=1 Tax=Brassica napus TaxID=3708 RepID=A0A078IE77_BRANA|nr:BnaC09g52030D [Brassica napus]